MATPDLDLTTGLPGLDRVLKGLLPGDNLVWQVDYINEYEPFVKACVEQAVAKGKKVVYFRFARHAPLLDERPGLQILELQPEHGFETFITEIHRVIVGAGRGVYFVFDCLSDLVVDWCSDRMLGNFFMLTCPFIAEHDSIGYFSVLRNHHSFHAINPITETTQILINVFRHHDKLYIHPHKVQRRHSSTMYNLHVWEGAEFVPVTQSMVITEILGETPWSRLDSATIQLGFWSSTFTRAERTAAAMAGGEAPPPDLDGFIDQLLRMAISRDERILELAREYFTLENIVAIRRRMIGTGLIGGKSVGMLLARAILCKRDEKWKRLLEPHDSFFIGADVFYTYLVQNGLWWAKQKQKREETYLDDIGVARRQMLAGNFPEYIIRQFADLLDYFGQSPIIVRSSSLLEDAFGNAFAGKYDSVFCANQGSRDQRMEEFLSAVRTVYASNMSENALKYRAARGLLDRDEQMALLVQRVSGSVYGKRFFPQSAGVALSFNPYVWNENIDPNAGVMRIVFGLGTRAVDRADDDYTRVVALNAPERRPEANFDEVREYAQNKVDCIDLEGSQEASCEFEEIAKESPDLPLSMFASRDTAMERRAAERGIRDVFPWVLTFDRLLQETDLVADMRDMLMTLQESYQYPVDLEYTLNFFDENEYRINLVQCRPLQVRGVGVISDPPEHIEAHDLVLRTSGPVVGQSRVGHITRIIYVVPATYGELGEQDRYAVARLIGKLTRTEHAQEHSTMIMGPGRWGTTTPALGIPVNFTEINSVDVVCEIVTMREDLVPDVSLGTHFFNELVEMDMLYIALFPGREGYSLNREFLEGRPSCLTELLPDAGKWENVIRVIDLNQCSDCAIVLNANAVKQRVLCYCDRG